MSGGPAVIPAIAGVDEVGRGALFGPVAAAAVLVTPTLEREFQEMGVADSKQLTPKRRVEFAALIRDRAVCAVGTASVEEIDRLNILQASLLAMRRAVEALSPAPDLCLVDGRQAIPELNVRQNCLVGGDRQSIAIAAASVVAKVWRDTQIERLAADYPQYDLARNKGYGTAKHRAALLRYGPTPLHRQSFKPCRVQPSASGAELSKLGDVAACAQ